MSYKSELAAMKYLADKRPDKFRLKLNKYEDFPVVGDMKVVFTLIEKKKKIYNPEGVDMVVWEPVATVSTSKI